MNAVPALLPALPEIVLALGALALVAYGAFASAPRTRSTGPLSPCSSSPG